MFSNDKIIYLQMQKTGSTHIAHLLDTYVGGARGVKHAQLKDRAAGRTVIGSVRNPWDWYVSLWAFGCAGKGAVRESLTSAAPHRLLGHLRRHWMRPADVCWGAVRHREWTRVYADSDDPALFRQWLALLLGRRGTTDLQKEYIDSPMHRFAGYMTFRFCRLYIDYASWIQELAAIGDTDALNAWYDRKKVIDEVVRMEHLEPDLLAALRRAGYAPDEAAILGETSRNRSQHRRWTTYYDAESAALVAQRDRFLIERFGYAGPPV